MLPLNRTQRILLLLYCVSVCIATFFCVPWYFNFNRTDVSTSWLGYGPIWRAPDDEIRAMVATNEILTELVGLTLVFGVLLLVARRR